jgi:energy-coupling factor transporter ATP-binding protein EcfA2
MKELTVDQQQMLNKFKQKIVLHPHLHSVLDELHSRTLNHSGQPLSAVIGPTGVGKSTLFRQVQRALAERDSERIKSDPGFIPYVGVEARSPERGSFEWKRFYQDILEKADEIHLNFKQVPSDEALSIVGKNGGSACSTTTLRVAIEKMLQYRGLPTLLIDESQHFLKMASGRRLLDQMDTLKSISNMTGVKIILFGTYQLLRLGQLSDQLARRCREIHFGRYRLDDPVDVQVFQNTVATFQKALPIESSLDLVQQWEYLYRGSLGCVGNLKDWLVEALEQALRSERGEIVLEDLKKTIPSEASLNTMAHDLRTGEDKWAERDAKSEDLDRLLGFAHHGPERSTSFISGKQVERRRRVGVRNPIRDMVGLGAGMS